MEDVDRPHLSSSSGKLRQGLRVPKRVRPKDPRWLTRLRIYAAPTPGFDDDVPGLAFAARIDPYEDLSDDSLPPLELGIADTLDLATRRRWELATAWYGESVCYENLWFTWEIVRRASRHWRTHAWWERQNEAGLSPEQLAALEYRQRHLGSELVRHFGGPRVTRGRRYCTPLLDGTCAPAARDDEVELLHLLGPYVRTPVRLRLDASEPPLPTCTSVLVDVDLSASNDEVGHYLDDLRRERRILSGTAPRRWRVWGGEVISARDAIEFLDHLVTGGTMIGFAETLVQRRSLPQTEDAPSTARNLTKELGLLGRRLLHVLRKEPLAALRGSVDLPR